MKRMLAVLALAAIGGCSAGATTPQASPTPVVCNALVLAPPPLLYPENGATGVPDGGFTLIVGFATAFPLSLTSFGNPSVNLVATAVPSTLPTPSATPVPGASEAAYSVPALVAHATYVVSAVNNPGAVCQFTAVLGSFTTQ